MAPGITMMDYGRGTIKARDSKNVQQMSHLLPLAFSCPTVSILRQIGVGPVLSVHPREMSVL